MRNPERISPFLATLSDLWQQKVPDWRFGQFMSNFLGFVYQETGRDIFFIEDDEMERLLVEFFTPAEEENP